MFSLTRTPSNHRRTYLPLALNLPLALSLLLAQTGFLPSLSLAAPSDLTTPATAASQTTPAQKSAGSNKAAATQTKGVVQSARLAPLPGSPVPGSSSVKSKDGQLPPLAPPLASKAASAAKSAQLAELEKLMFGQAQPSIPVEYRLDRLESEVYHHTNPEWDANKRIERLNETLVGAGTTAPSGQPSAQSSGPSTDPYTAGMPNPTPDTQPGTALPDSSGQPYRAGSGTPFVPPYNADGTDRQNDQHQPYYGAAAPDLNSPDFQKVIPRGQLEQYGLQQINAERAAHGLSPLEWNELAYKVAQELVTDLCKRNTVAHQNTAGENPDVRYTRAGGTDAIVESIISEKTPSKPTPNKAMIYSVINKMMNHQDERESLLSPHATGLALHFNWSSGKDKLITCFEVVTKHAEISEIPSTVSVGEKIEVTGVMLPGYKFQKITLAWEGLDPNAGAAAEEQDEALPYFAPLDYEAYARKSEHDWEKATRILQITGIGLALAGGIFIPPVALAAPLIAASTSGVKPHAVSDIPVRGGVRVDGAMFSHKVQIAKDQKEGIYYITIWARNEVDDKPVPVSRRAIIAKNSESGQTNNKETASSKDLFNSNSKETEPANISTAKPESLAVPAQTEGSKPLLSENTDHKKKHKKDKREKSKRRNRDISAQQKADGE